MRWWHFHARQKMNTKKLVEKRAAAEGRLFLSMGSAPLTDTARLFPGSPGGHLRAAIDRVTAPCRAVARQQASKPWVCSFWVSSFAFVPFIPVVAGTRKRCANQSKKDVWRGLLAHLPFARRDNRRPCLKLNEKHRAMAPTTVSARDLRRARGVLGHDVVFARPSLPARAGRHGCQEDGDTTGRVCPLY